MKHVLILILLLFAFNGNATHNRGGQITYRHLYGTTYEFTIKTCTKASSDANRSELVIYYGDGSEETVDLASRVEDLQYDVYMNEYVSIHEYTGPGTYYITMVDPNRNEGVINIAASVSQPFCVQTSLVISPFVGSTDSSPQFQSCPCPEFACIGSTYVYNPGVFDPDGDSISYELTVPRTDTSCRQFVYPIEYEYPDDVGGGNGTMTLDPVTGNLIWDNPSIPGEYNIAILIQEWRNGVPLGYVVHDVQITAISSTDCNNEKPEIAPVDDQCVIAGDIINFNVTATDADTQPDRNKVDFSAYGASFTQNPASTFSAGPPAPSVTGTFNWNTACSNISPSPYQVTFEARDNHPQFALSDFEVALITVKGNAVNNVAAQQELNGVRVLWDPHSCGSVTEYRVYRFSDSLALDTIACCVQGSPNSYGYELIGTTNDTTLIDNDELNVGTQYCYVVTAVINKAETCISPEACLELEFNIPVITNVSVGITDVATGQDTIRWANPTEFDEAAFPGPYSYLLYRIENGTKTLVYTSPQFASMPSTDTQFVDANINTNDIQYYYEVVLDVNGIEVNTTSTASSVFLTIIPDDKALNLSWTEFVPWSNYRYEIYKETSPGSGTFNLLGSSTNQSYIDTGLVNGQDYCYYIRSVGEFTQGDLPDSTINLSQRVCGTPWDTTAPCPPILSLTTACDQATNSLSWLLEDDECADEITRYNLYYQSDTSSEFTLIEEYIDRSELSRVFTDSTNLAGCYYITAIDSIPYNNESLPSNIVCSDGCTPIYELPNVFTPNNQGLNDIYTPILPFAFVTRIEITVFNRYGRIVFTTNDPMINWDGTYYESGEPVSDGVYFYTIKIYYGSLSGETSEDRRGNIHIFR